MVVHHIVSVVIERLEQGSHVRYGGWRLVQQAGCELGVEPPVIT
jgi:hypothetical protein